ncbi:diguanylate cyclase domain-containing protein [Marinobacter sp. LV10MA510-1]|uniref:diguanylate cyclase domain-containing protein n=1 Tax=Marinobacter sp. LV10MA510-1 TaxID=1415567 RepID=UPI000BF82D26|nr:diguanylate cyclase [Marinobacter sp. LV10MA510-1]PFG11502.1 PAS domain S-box-containing protein/diguanylate cyclase (GGDEF)-like protein [Marinobacter sp. LV10MA510-1]
MIGQKTHRYLANAAITSSCTKYCFVVLAVVSLVASIAIWPLSVSHSFIEHGFYFLLMATFAITCTIIAYHIHVTHRIQREALKQADSVSAASLKSDQLIRTIINSTPNMMGYWDRDLRCRYANNAFSEWFGMPPEDVIGIRFQDLVSEQLYALNEPHIRAVLAGEPQRFERTLNKADGSVGHIIGNYIPDFEADGTVQGFSIQASEITVLKEVEAKLKLAACVFDNTLDGVLITDVNGVILSVNPGFVEITGYTLEESVGQTPRILHSDRHDQAFYASMWEEINAKGRWHGEIWNRHKDGELYLQRMTISMVLDEAGEPMRYVSVFSDITALWQKDEHIRHLAFHDALTDLPNRTLLMDRINQQILHANREESHFALMFLDLDGFKLVNDQLGHKIGDDLLKDVAKRLLALVRSSDTIARVGGDEFIFILNNPRGRDEITEVANRIVASINEPIEILGVVVQIGVSLGIATFPADGDSSSDLIINADSAMYAAKSVGKNNIRFFSAEH